MKFEFDKKIIVKPGKYSIKIKVRGHDQEDCGKSSSMSYEFFSDSFECTDNTIADISCDLNIDLKVLK